MDHGQAAETFGAFLGSGDFFEAVFENWESEFLQMGSYVVLTIFLFQKGSSESKPIGKTAPQDEDPRKHRDDPKAPWPVRRGGLWLVLYENSLLILFAVLFLGSFAGHAIGGAAAYSEEQLQHGGAAVTSARVPRHVAVLVRVVPELAERVHGRRGARRRGCLSPAARLTGIQSRSPLRTRRPATETGRGECPRWRSRR